MKGRIRFVPTVAVLLALLFAGSRLLVPTGSAQSQLTSPEKFFGFQLGSDKKMARWDRMIEYYKLLEKEGGGKLKVTDMGPTTMGNPFLLVIISSPANMAKLDRLREVNARISDPRGLSEQEVKNLVGEGKAVICQSMSLHATEIGGTQMAPELAYDLLTRKDEETQRILDNVVFLMVPSFNPDGEIMVADWYQKTLGTEYEGSNLPYLYHKYAGHDNNRDAFQTNLVESQYMAKIMFRDWSVPQAYVDHHHMGSNGARIYVPPYAEPIRPYADPLLWRELSWYGAHIAYKEEEAGLSGVLNEAQYSGWGHFGFHWMTPFHNIAGMLTESASARLASPIYIHPDQLRGGARNLPTYEAETIFPNPWPGGWWRLRDIVERQKVAAWSTLDLAARNKETVLWNAYLKAKRQTERGAQGKPAAYVIPATQHDRPTAIKMINKLLIQGVEIKQATKGFNTIEGSYYPEGCYVVSLAQPKMGLIRYLLGRTFYPDNEWTRNRDGLPMRPYDMATDTMFEFMGVRVDPVDEIVPADLQKLQKLTGPVSNDVRMLPRVGNASYMFFGSQNDSFKALNLLFEKGIAVRRIDKADLAQGLRPGDFVVAGSTDTMLPDIARQTGVNFVSLQREVTQGAHEVKRLRIGMYQRYGGGNIDEGWTRLVLEQFSFPYTSLMDAEIRKGSLSDKHDVIILPDDSTAAITGERGAAPPAAPVLAAGRGAAPGAAPAAAAGRGEGGGGGGGSVPPEYRSGIGTEGVNALRAFVQRGGTLVTLGSASNFAIERLGLPIRNILANKTSMEFWCPGSTLNVTFDNTNPLAYGMPAEGLALYMSGSPAFELGSTDRGDQYEVIVRYAEHNLLQSGWLIGEENLARKAAMVATRLGDGRVILIGFRTQHRAQTHGTFKLLFNALVR
ncbi:MAG: peptidase M14 family protein [Acidobacteriia bacterium]|nr:peptidase M14 family protein [Terriglobia bacterium]